METAALKRFAQAARRQLREQVSTRLEQVLRSDSVEIREKAKVVEDLKRTIQASTKDAVIDQVAYTWFNRFCALRYMDVNYYTRIGTVSPAEGFTQPEILQEAKQGVIDESIKVDHKKVFDLLNGRQPSNDPQQEAYRLLLAGACNAWHAQMPFLFPEIEDYTELLMPDDLLSENSVLQGMRETLTQETCQDVEVIGWLYQYYISERKDEVFAALKENQKIEAKDIPAATQLFTPHWIVRYLVENSLGRLWMLNHPDSKLVERMEYYIKPAQVETDFLKISNPEEIKVCDPACGSGHMLTYAFDLLYAIYEEQGYDAVQIPGLILQKNLYGIEIDKRAGDLAAFAMVMKAREKDKRFFSRGLEPNICVLENVTFNEAELKQYIDAVGRDLFTGPLKETLRQFEQAENFGSLIRPILADAGYIHSVLEGKNLGGGLFLYGVHERVMKVLKFAEFLAPHYHVVVANPPYMNSSGMNDELRSYAKDFFPDSKSDLFAMFIERNFDFIVHHGFLSMITMQGWMFLTSYEQVRQSILNKKTIIAMMHLGPRAFDTISGEVVSTTAFVISNHSDADYIGSYYRLIDGNSEAEKQKMFIESKDHIEPSYTKYFYSANTKKFKIIPGSPIAYWLSDKATQTFKGKKLSNYAISGGRCKTHNDEMYVRQIWEVSYKDIGSQNKKWKLYNKGGISRRWFGNLDFVVNWSETAKNSYALHGGLSNASTWNRAGVTWSGISSGDTAYRLKYKESEYASASPTILTGKDIKTEMILGFLNTPISYRLMEVINPTMQVNVGDALKLPFVNFDGLESVQKIVTQLIDIFQNDWNYLETSFEFSRHPLSDNTENRSKISGAWKNTFAAWQKIAMLAQQLEIEKNVLFLEAYNLLNELTPDVPLREITLNCNPCYRYGDNKSDDELEKLLLADTMKEFISYGVGCMFGRYSLEKPGLILANAGDTAEEYLRQVPEPSFPPDEDNAIPVLDGEWFEDDIVERFKKFIKITFGTEHYDENLAFIEGAIGRDIRGYFVKDFYNEHVKMYKKRPIYWMFSSPKGSFNVLMYMHRYRPDTISVILNNYLRQYREKLNAHKAHQESISRNSSASQGEKTKALKEVEWVKKVLSELKEYEDEILYPLAMQKIAIDLDDGVKVNYGKLGKALKEIKGL